MILLLGAALACDDTTVQALWPSWGPVDGKGLIRVQTGGDNATVQIIDSQGGAWPVSGGRSIESAPGDWFSFKWPSAMPDGVATLIAEPGPVQVEVEVVESLAVPPPDGNPRLGEVLFESRPWSEDPCDTDGPTRVVASAQVVLPGASTGGFVAEILHDGEVLLWAEVPPSREAITVELPFSAGSLTEICLDVDIYDPGHFTVAQHELDCEPVPEQFLVPEEQDTGCGCMAPGGSGGAALAFGLLALVRRRR